MVHDALTGKAHYGPSLLHMHAYVENRCFSVIKKQESVRLLLFAYATKAKLPCCLEMKTPQRSTSKTIVLFFQMMILFSR